MTIDRIKPAPLLAQAPPGRGPGRGRGGDGGLLAQAGSADKQIVDPEAAERGKKTYIACHGATALAQIPRQRLAANRNDPNHRGVKMDAENYDSPGLGDVGEVTNHLKQVNAQGMGVISMKLVGEGAFHQS